MPAPGTHNEWILYEGSHFSESFAWPDIDDETGYSAHMTIRQRRDPESTVLLDLTSDGGGLVLSISDGKLLVSITIPAPDSENLDVPFVVGQGHIAHYDVEITPPSGADYTWRALMGTIAYSRQVIP